MKTNPALLVGAAILCGAPALAQLPDVAIVAAASASLSDCRYSDVQSYLTATGRFGSVTVVDCTTTTPALADLMAFDAVLTWSNVNYFDSTTLGDNLADYVDAGGGVVVAVFSTSTANANRSLQGRWISGGYEVIQSQGGSTTGPASLGPTLVPGHPTMAGVATLSATTAFRPTPTIALVQGMRIAEWDDGAPLVAVGDNQSRIDLGLYPPSNNCSGAFWDFTTDGDVLVANALELSALGGSVNIGTNYCTAIANVTGVPSRMSATGQTSVAANNVTIMASDLPPSQFGIFVVSNMTGFIPAGTSSNGNICLGGVIGRYNQTGQILSTGATGEFSLPINLMTVPQGNGLAQVMPGEDWHFQAWHRSAVGLGSNFSDGLTISFQ